MAFGDAFDNIQGWFDTLNQRERRLLALMGSLFAVMAVVVPMYLMLATISDIKPIVSSATVNPSAAKRAANLATLRIRTGSSTNASDT